MTDARGKVGGQVFSKNRSGAYVRTKVTPSNAQTSRQSFVRSLLSSISQSWSGLTQAQRDSFDAAVNQWTSTDIFGDIKNPTGKNLYTKLNFNLGNSGLTGINSAPIKLEMPTLNISAVENEAGILTIVGANIAGTGKLVISATAVQSQGTGFYKGKFRQIGTIATTAIANADITALYTAKFGQVTGNENIGFEFKIILANGQMSTPLSMKATEV